MNSLPRDPHSILIIDRRPEYARLLVALAAAELPTRSIAAFEDLGAAEAWIAAAEMPVAVFADVAAAGGEAIARAEGWRRARAGVMLVAMFDANVEGQAAHAEAIEADATLAKPCCRSDWRASVGLLLGVAEPMLVSA